MFGIPRHFIVAQRAEMEVPRYRTDGYNLGAFFESHGRMWYTSQPFKDLAIKQYEVERLTAARVSRAADSLFHWDPTKSMPVIFENHVQKLISARRVHTFRIRQLGVDGKEGRVQLTGGEAGSWSGLRLDRSTVRHDGPLFPVTENQTTISMLCRLRGCDDSGGITNWAARGFNGGFVPLICIPGDSIHLPCVQSVASAIGWYDAHNPGAPLDAAVAALVAADAAPEKETKGRWFATEDAVGEFARARAVVAPGVPPFPAAYAAVEAGLKARHARPAALKEALAALRGGGAAATAAASGAGVPVVTPAGGAAARAPFPLVFVVDAAKYATMRGVVGFSGVAAGSLQASVVQYVMEVDTSRAIPNVAALEALYWCSADKWTMGADGTPVPPHKPTYSPPVPPGAPYTAGRP